MLSFMLPELLVSSHSQSGLFTAAQVRAAGYTDSERRARIKSGRWVALRRGIYAEREVVDNTRSNPYARHQLEVQAALLAVGRPSFASHTSACITWSLGLVTPPPFAVTLTCPDGETHTGRGLRIRVSDLAADERATASGTPVTTLGRTVFDTARQLSFREAVPIADQALRTGQLTTEELEMLLKRYHTWLGVGRASRVIGFADGRSESVGESLARVFYAEEGLPSPDLQVEFSDHQGLIGRTDFYWRQYRTIGEFDGRIKYAADGAVLYAEKRREDRLRTHDEVVRFGHVDITRRRQELRQRLQAAFARGQQRPPPPSRSPWWP